MSEKNILLTDVSWTTYESIGESLAHRRGVRLSYDAGNLEIMTTSTRREIYKKQLGLFIEIMAEELTRPFATAGSMTFNRKDLGKGIEPDDCFWFQHELKMRCKLTWVPLLDPAPDLVLEIDVSPSILNRPAICGALGIGEIWFYNGEALRVLRLQADGTYLKVDKSQIFPEVPIEQILAFLEATETKDLLTVIGEFQNWIRQLGKLP
jgi:Uma2 family endonuclease